MLHQMQPTFLDVLGEEISSQQIFELHDDLRILWSWDIFLDTIPNDTVQVNRKHHSDRVNISYLVNSPPRGSLRGSVGGCNIAWQLSSRYDDFWDRSRRRWEQGRHHADGTILRQEFIDKRNQKARELKLRLAWNCTSP